MKKALLPLVTVVLPSLLFLPPAPAQAKTYRSDDAPSVTDTLPQKRKAVSAVEVNRERREVTVIFDDGSS